MTTHRDLYQEIEDELRNSAESDGAGGLNFDWKTMVLMLLALAMVIVIVTVTRVLWADSNPLSAVAAMVQGSPTPTATVTAQPTDVSTVAPIPTGTPVPAMIEPTLAPTIAPLPTEPPTETPAPTRAWASNVGAPVPASRHYTSMTLSQIQGVALLDVSVAMGYTDAGLLEELDYVRALTSGFLDDSLINSELPLRGVLPYKPLFLFVGQMEGPGDFAGDAGTLRVKLPYGGPMIKAQLSSQLLRQVDNASLTVNSWQVKGGWVWFVGSAPKLEQAIKNCRDSSLPANSNYSMPTSAGECDSLQGTLSGGELEVFVSTLMGVNADGGGLTPLLPEPAAPIEGRWIYADFGRNSAQLALPEDVRGLTQELGMSYGLMRASWQDNQLTPTMLLNPTFADGLYLYNYQWVP